MAVRIKIVGVGGGGNNAVERMLETNIPMVDYITTVPMTVASRVLMHRLKSKLVNERTRAVARVQIRLWQRLQRTGYFNSGCCDNTFCI